MAKLKTQTVDEPQLSSPELRGPKPKTDPARFLHRADADDEQPEPELSTELAELFFTRRDVLRVLGNPHPDTLDRWRRRGVGPPSTLLPGRQIVFSKTSFFQWMKEREQQPKPVRQRRGR
jgi:hypothetical protein